MGCTDWVTVNRGYTSITSGCISTFDVYIPPQMKWCKLFIRGGTRRGLLDKNARKPRVGEQWCRWPLCICSVTVGDDCKVSMWVAMSKTSGKQNTVDLTDHNCHIIAAGTLAYWLTEYVYSELKLRALPDSIVWFLEDDKIVPDFSLQHFQIGPGGRGGGW